MRRSRSPPHSCAFAVFAAQVPALPRRLPASDLVKAVKWTKKIMNEEGHAVPMLLHIFQLLVRFAAHLLMSVNRRG